METLVPDDSKAHQLPIGLDGLERGPTHAREALGTVQCVNFPIPASGMNSSSPPVDSVADRQSSYLD